MKAKNALAILALLVAVIILAISSKCSAASNDVVNTRPIRVTWVR